MKKNEIYCEEPHNPDNDDPEVDDRFSFKRHIEENDMTEMYDDPRFWEGKYPYDSREIPCGFIQK